MGYALQPDESVRHEWKEIRPEFTKTRLTMKLNTFLISSALALVLFTTSASSSTIKSIEDLRDIWFGHLFPRHGLQLLNWFVYNAEIDKRDIIQPWFDPTRGDYGFEFYKNENLLPALTDPRLAYYTVGDLKKPTSRALPQYVTQNYYNSLRSGDRNRDRMVVRVVKAEGSGQLGLDQVYVTQLFPLNDKQANSFDPKQTFTIDFSLLREIKKLQAISNATSAGLDQFLNLAGYEPCLAPEWQTCALKSMAFQRLQMVHIQNESDCQPLRLEVRSTENGYVRMSWSNIPMTVLDHYVSVALFNGDESEIKLAEAPVGNNPSGHFNICVALNPGLQIRLLKRELLQRDSYWSLYGNEIWRASEFNDANGLIPADINGFKASLQLYTKNGYACARLFLKKTFTTWKDQFYNSWVGFYSGNCVKNTQYNTYQWVVKFHKETSQEIPEYDVYVYESSMFISPGAQARFMPSKSYASELVRTLSWGGEA